MPKRDRKKKSQRTAAGHLQLPKDALERVNLGQSFAEYDSLLRDPGVFVRTPAIEAAVDSNRGRCFFVGRRGTGKTAISSYLALTQKNVLSMTPQIFDLQGFELEVERFRDARQRHFKSLVVGLKRAMLGEVLFEWIKTQRVSNHSLPAELTTEIRDLPGEDFDSRAVHLTRQYLGAVERKNDTDWLGMLRVAKGVSRAMDELAVDERWHYTLVLDRIDESWDGSDAAVLA